MEIKKFFIHELIVRRLSTVSGDKKKMVSTGTVDAYFARIDTSDSGSGIFSVYGATHKAWADISEDIKQGDQIEHDNELYLVKAVVKEGESIAENEHLEIYMRLYGD